MIDKGAPARAASGPSRLLGQLARVGISVALLLWLLSAVDPGRLQSAVANLDPVSWVGAALLLILQTALLAWRWHRLVHMLGGRLPPANALQWVFVGLFFNSALPTSVGGDAVKVWLLHRSSTAPGLAFASVAIERLTGVVMLALMIAACVAAPWAALEPLLRVSLLAAGPALLMSLGLVAFADRLRWAWLPAGVAMSFGNVARSLRRLFSMPGAMVELAALGLASSLSGIAAAYVLGQALGIQASLAVYVVFVGGAVLLSVLPISLGGWGVREAGMVGLFGTIGVEPERALMLSVIWAGLAVAISLPGGLLWWFAQHPTSSDPKKEV